MRIRPFVSRRSTSCLFIFLKKFSTKGFNEPLLGVTCSRSISSSPAILVTSSLIKSDPLSILITAGRIPVGHMSFMEYSSLKSMLVWQYLRNNSSLSSIRLKKQLVHPTILLLSKAMEKARMSWLNTSIMIYKIGLPTHISGYSSDTIDTSIS